jgi:DNA polymerase-3 subunit delta
MKAQWRDWPSMMKAPLKPCYWISSDDPLLKEEALQSLRAAAKQQGFEKETLSLNSAADWDHFEGLRQNFSLFAPKPYYECHMSDAKFKDGVQAHLKACTQTAPGSACIVMVTPKIETATQKTKWFEALLQDMVWLPLWPLEGEAFTQYIKGLVHSAGLQFTPDAWSLLMTQCTELLSAKQTLMRLSSLPPQVIDSKVLQDYLPDTLPCEVFDLADAALNGDAVQTTKLFFALNAQADYQVLMLWALTRDIETLLALKSNQTPFILPKRKNAFMRAMNRFTETSLQDLWRRSAQVDRALKGGKEGFLAPDQLIDLYIAFSGATIKLS